MTEEEKNAIRDAYNRICAGTGSSARLHLLEVTTLSDTERRYVPAMAARLRFGSRRYLDCDELWGNRGLMLRQPERQHGRETD